MGYYGKKRINSLVRKHYGDRYSVSVGSYYRLQTIPNNGKSFRIPYYELNNGNIKEFIEKIGEGVAFLKKVDGDLKALSIVPSRNWQKAIDELNNKYGVILSVEFITKTKARVYEDSLCTTPVVVENLHDFKHKLNKMCIIKKIIKEHFDGDVKFEQGMYEIIGCFSGPTFEKVVAMFWSGFSEDDEQHNIEFLKFCLS